MSGRSVCALAVALAVVAGSAGCGGGTASVAWKGRPRSGAVEGGQMLFGTLVNRSARPLAMRGADVRVLGRRGRELPAAAAFSGGYNAGIALRGLGASHGADNAGIALRRFGAETCTAAMPSAGDGANVDLAPRATVQLS